MGNFVLTISKQWDQNITYLKKKLILEEDPSLRFIFSQVHSYKKVNIKVRLLKMDLDVFDLITRLVLITTVTWLFVLCSARLKLADTVHYFSILVCIYVHKEKHPVTVSMEYKLWLLKNENWCYYKPLGVR